MRNCHGLAPGIPIYSSGNDDVNLSSVGNSFDDPGAKTTAKNHDGNDNYDLRVR